MSCVYVYVGEYINTCTALIESDTSLHVYKRASPHILMLQSPTCPCPGETQSSEQRRLSILVRPEQTELFVRWSATRFDGVRLNLTSVVVNPRTSGVLVRMCIVYMYDIVCMCIYIQYVISVDDVRILISVVSRV